MTTKETEPSTSDIMLAVVALRIIAGEVGKEDRGAIDRVVKWLTSKMTNPWKSPVPPSLSPVEVTK